MAEIAPLTTARMHARKATEEGVNSDVASNEHKLAAHDYAKAAKSTSDSEALRILKLLEQQHLQLANLVKSSLSSPSKQEPASADAKQAQPESTVSGVKSPEKTASPKPRVASGTAAAATRVGSSQIRDSSPSLARDIASRRGIPQPTRNSPSLAAQARARQLSPESRRSSRHAPAPNIPPSVMDSQNLAQARKQKKAEDDDAFANFYSSITTGTMSKLSSVLAFAGLPLTSEDNANDQGQKQKSSKQTVSASNEPDVKKIFSKAALNAIEDEHRQRGSRGHVFGPAESFYVVQTGGGTYSYADIAKAQHQQTAGIDQEDEEAFQDARESQAKTPPQASRRFTHQPKVNSSSGRTDEELELENKTLKQMLEKVATRLSNFEAHAQDASMAALTQSMVSLGDASGAILPDSAMHERIRQLEQQIEKQAEDKQKLENLAAKQEKTLKKYKTQWGDIIKNAKEREKAKKGKAEKGADEPFAEGEDG